MAGMNSRYCAHVAHNEISDGRQGQNRTSQAGIDNGFGHAEHRRRCFILGYHYPTLLPDVAGAGCSILPEASQHNAQYVTAYYPGGRVHQHIHRGNIEAGFAYEIGLPAYPRAICDSPYGQIAPPRSH